MCFRDHDAIRDSQHPQQPDKANGQQQQVSSILRQTHSCCASSWISGKSIWPISSLHSMTTEKEPPDRSDAAGAGVSAGKVADAGQWAARGLRIGRTLGQPRCAARRKLEPGLPQLLNSVARVTAQRRPPELRLSYDEPRRPRRGRAPDSRAGTPPGPGRQYRDRDRPGTTRTPTRPGGGRGPIMACAAVRTPRPSVQ